MSMTEYVSIVKNPYVNIEGLDKTNCCQNLMLNGMGSWKCEKYDENIGYSQEGAFKALMYCQNYYRDHNCWLELSKKVEKEKADKEKAEREKIEKEEKALFEKLIADFTKSIEKKPNDGENYRLRGGAYSQRKMYDQAIIDFNEAIRINSNDAEAFAFRGATYSQKNENDKAIVDFNEAIRINPDCKNAYWFRAAMFGVIGEHDKSIADYEEALRIDPKDGTTKNLLENAKRLKNEEQERIKYDSHEKRKKIISTILSISIGAIIGGITFTFYPMILHNGSLMGLISLALLIFSGIKFGWKGVVSVIIMLAILNGFAFSYIPFMGLIGAAIGALIGFIFIRKKIKYKKSATFV